VQRTFQIHEGLGHTVQIKPSNTQGLPRSRVDARHACFHMSDMQSPAPDQTAERMQAANDMQTPDLTMCEIFCFKIMKEQEQASPNIAPRYRSK
jgi:hypothetical protein